MIGGAIIIDVFCVPFVNEFACVRYSGLGGTGVEFVFGEASVHGVDELNATPGTNGVGGRGGTGGVEGIWASSLSGILDGGANCG